MSASSSAAVSPDGYQVFLSYSRRDLGAVTAIAQKLKEQYKLSVWFDGDMRPGANWMTEISDAIVASATVAVFLGPGGVGDWQTPEMQRALDRAAKGETRLIPVLLPGMSDN